MIPQSIVAWWRRHVVDEGPPDLSRLDRLDGRRDPAQTKES